MEGEAFKHFSADMIRRLCGPTNFSTGQTYFRAGRVVSLTRQGATAKGLVQGASFLNHRVHVDCSGDALPTVSCDCMRHSQWREACKHISAVLFAILEEVETSDPVAKIQKLIDDQVQDERRRDQHDAVLRGIIFHYFGERYLRAIVQKYGKGPGLKVTIAPEEEDGLEMSFIIPPRRVPSFLEAVEGRDNVVFEGDAAKLQISDARAEFEPDKEGTTILKISGARRKLSGDEAARAKISGEWVFHRNKFYAIKQSIQA